MGVFRFAVALLALVGLPAQTRQAAGISVEHLAPCTGLSEAECCEWTVRTANFKVTREQMPEQSARAIRLVCAYREQPATHAVCRAIAITRGFCAREAEQICDEKTARRSCEKNAPCAGCTAKLKKLGYRDTYWACRAATYLPEKKPESTTVIVVEEETGRDSKGNATRTVIRRRRKLR